MTPIDGLAIGTLSDQMRSLGGPFFNFRIPGEIRVGAFTINTNVKGDLPLFAIAGTFKGDCLFADTLSFDYFPEFNNEFKGKVEYMYSDTVQRIAKPIEDASQGVTKTIDTLRIGHKDSSATTEFVVHHGKLNNRLLQVEFFLENIDQTWIDTITSETLLENIIIDVTRQKVTIDFESQVRDSSVFQIRLKNISNDSIGVTKLSGQLFDTTHCTCLRPTKTDTMFIETKEPVTSVEGEDVHDSTVKIIRLTADRISMQFSHGQLWKIQIVDLLGRKIMETQQIGFEAQLSLAELKPGAYILYVTDGSTSVAKKILK